MRIGHSVAVATFLASIPTQPSFGEEDSRIVGTWRLLSYVVEVRQPERNYQSWGKGRAAT